jgi:hypothetical protein
MHVAAGVDDNEIRAALQVAQAELEAKKEHLRMKHHHGGAIELMDVQMGLSHRDLIAAAAAAAAKG